MKQQNRGKNIALAGTLLQAGIALVLLIVALRTKAYSVKAAVWYFVGGIGVWLMTALLFYCRKLELQEAEEIESLAARGETGGLFEAGRDLSLRPAAMRVKFIETWIVPAFTLLLGAYWAVMGVVKVIHGRNAAAGGPFASMENVAEGTLFVVISGFLAFLLSRYCTGMSSRTEWRPLRPAASQLLLGTAFSAVILAVFAAEWFGNSRVDVYAAIVIPLVQIVLAAEVLITLVLDFFRPRVPGEQRRFAYDSRILGMLAEPQRVGHSIAETLNYQFGFEVSKTWFYKLLGKALMPLIILGMLVMWGMSSLVIVRQGQKGVVLHWGRARQGRLLEPGLNVKWPWPVDTVRLFDTGLVHDLQIGVGKKRDPYMVKGKEFQLWTQRHGAREELPFLLAIPREIEPGTDAPAESAGDAPPPVHIINLVLDVQYRIADPYKYGYKYVEAGKMLQSAASREMVRYCASATLDTAEAGPGDRPQAIMTSGWEDASKALHERVDKVVGPDGLDLGVEIESVRLTAVHPPAEAAPDFEAVLAAERDQDRQRYQAEGVANKTLASAAGDPDLALELAMAIRRVEQLDSLAGLTDRPGQFDEYLRGYIRQAVERLKAFRKEIELEGLTGRLAGKTRAPAAPARFGDKLRQHLAGADAALGELLGQIADWSMLNQLAFTGGTARQRLAARQAENLLELLSVRAEGVRYDFSPVRKAAHEQADALFARGAGQAAKLVAEAQAYRLRTEMTERTRAERFQRELDNWRASPNLYVLDRRLDVCDEVLPPMIKYVICVDPNLVEVWLNWERETRGISTSAFEGDEADK